MGGLDGDRVEGSERWRTSHLVCSFRVARPPLAFSHGRLGFEAQLFYRVQQR